MKIKIFTFNPFEENTYILYDETLEAIIIDPGCNDPLERAEITNFISNHHLVPKRLINTHCHIDHVLGNAFISRQYDLILEAHEGEKLLLENQPTVARMYGVSYEPSPPITNYINEGDIISFGHTTLSILLTPGHSPASICLYHAASHQLIAGDVLFKNSIGRTDLPGGDYKTLIKSIKKKLLVLPEATIVYPGHGPSTTIGEEALYNPFLGDRI